MKTLIIYSSETGNTKMVCEKAFEYIMKIVEELNIKIGKQIFKGYPGLMLGL